MSWVELAISVPLFFSLPSRMFFKDLKKALYHHFQFTPNVRPMSTPLSKKIQTKLEEVRDLSKPLQREGERKMCWCMGGCMRERVGKRDRERQSHT
jgi:hypothetical protein